MSAGACLWVVAKKTVQVKGHMVTLDVFCNKLVADALTIHCPKHVLFTKEEAEAKQRASALRKARRELRKLQMAELASSPLAAFNPAFDEKGKRVALYTEAE